jgi:hypothetical protein
MDGTGDFFIGRRQMDGVIIRLSAYFKEWEKVKNACEFRNKLEQFREEAREQMKEEVRHG